jgi:hypothetical protein
VKALSFEDKIAYIHAVVQAVMNHHNVLVYGYGSKFELFNMIADHITR